MYIQNRFRFLIAAALVSTLVSALVAPPAVFAEGDGNKKIAGTAKQARTIPCSKVKLVLQITIDQLRGDLPLRFRSRFGEGGFRYLLDNGAYFANAHYKHADTETAPGHATLVTGATPAQHGIISSEWWDPEKKKIVYAVEDENYPLLGENLESTAGSSTTIEGRAPTNLQSTTIGDEIFIASEKQARVFGVSGKDRGAVLPAGRAGKAFWLSSGKMVTSSYYYKKPPQWVTTWNDRKLADSYKDKNWELLNNRETYWRKDLDKRPYEGGFEHLKKEMPKSFATEKSKHFYKGLMHSYVNDELVLDFAKHLISDRQLGKRESVDYLSISFSSIDYVGHTWGIESLESEDTLLRVDRNLADLFKHVDSTVGLENTMIVLSADHGVAEIAEYMQGLGFPSKVIDSRALVKHIRDSLKKRFSTDKDLVAHFLYPYIYLNEAVLSDLKLDMEEVEEETAKAAMAFPGITYAVGEAAIKEGELPTDNANTIYARIINNYHPKRSGHVHLVADQYKMLVHWEWNGKPGMHGTVWSYDSFVPVVFTGPGIKARRIVRRVGPHDIAPTIAAYLGIKPPSGAVGDPLVEVVPETNW
ncbi:MAG: alkaline phosphatase family protein [Candidatus Obscuribacterales bacterium]|nr:alkaline phosphatase family protein [Candidatus Obscuribacterales bacterium]